MDKNINNHILSITQNKTNTKNSSNSKYISKALDKKRKEKNPYY